MKLQQMNGKQFFITLPNPIIRAKGWVKGEELKVLIDGRGELVIKKDDLKKKSANNITEEKPPVDYNDSAKTSL